MTLGARAETLAKELREFGGLDVSPQKLTATDGAAVAFEWFVYAYCIRHGLANPGIAPAPRPAAERLMAWVLIRRPELARAVWERAELEPRAGLVVSAEQRACGRASSGRGCAKRRRSAPWCPILAADRRPAGAGAAASGLGTGLGGAQAGSRLSRRPSTGAQESLSRHLGRPGSPKGFMSASLEHGPMPDHDAVEVPAEDTLGRRARHFLVCGRAERAAGGETGATC